MSKRWIEGALVGTRLGSCVLERPLGIGGASAVYLARQERPRRQVAVKVLHPRLAGDPRAWSVFLARFRREADASAALDHANIVPIYEFGEQDGMAYLVMPYLADGSLADVLADVGALPLDRAITYLSQTAAALDYAHAHGIIHRDVKPSNLLLHPDGRLLLADFGIAHSLGMADQGPSGSSASHGDRSLLDEGVLMGTPHYMAPEQIRGGPVTAATDVYALGILAYTILAGEPPFIGTTAEILRQQLTDSPMALSSVRPDVPPQVEDAIAWALAKRPGDRPASAGAFATALDEMTLRRLPDMPVGRGRVTGTLPLARAMAGPGPFIGGGYPVDHGGALADDSPTLYGSGMAGMTGMVGAAGDQASSGPPTWPVFTSWEGGSHETRSPAGGAWRLIALGMAAVIVLGLALLGPGLLSTFANVSMNAPGGQISGGAANPLLTVTATATATVAPSPTPVANWLVVQPTYANLGCSSGSKSIQVIMQNLGSADTSWSADVPLLGGVSLTPSSGDVPAGGSVALTLSNTSLFVSHQGTIIFTADNPQAGQPATLRYTTRACHK